jgi:hypothetical protein
MPADEILDRRQELPGNHWSITAAVQVHITMYRTGLKEGPAEPAGGDIAHLG